MSSHFSHLAYPTTSISLTKHCSGWLQRYNDFETIRQGVWSNPISLSCFTLFWLQPERADKQSQFLPVPPFRTIVWVNCHQLLLFSLVSGCVLCPRALSLLWVAIHVERYVATLAYYTASLPNGIIFRISFGGFMHSHLGHEYSCQMWPFDWCQNCWPSG